MDRLYRYCCWIHTPNTIKSECPICLLEKDLVSLKKCKHSYCVACITEWVSSNIKDDNAECPLCRMKIKYKKAKQFPYYYVIEIM
jgi:hypothetical protein